MFPEKSDHGAAPRAVFARILVLDDEPMIRDFVSRVLQAGGHEVVTLVPAHGAAQLVAETRFDLVITNSVMPANSGARLVARLRRQFPEIPLLHIDDQSHPHSAEFPPDVPTLGKPFSAETLRARVQELLQRQG